MDRGDTVDIAVPKGTRGPKENKVKRETKVSKGLRDRKDAMVHKDPKGPQGPKVKRGLKVPKVRKGVMDL